MVRVDDRVDQILVERAISDLARAFDKEAADENVPEYRRTAARVYHKRLISLSSNIMVDSKR